jgi:hypothetical protein
MDATLPPYPAVVGSKVAERVTMAFIYPFEHFFCKIDYQCVYKTVIPSLQNYQLAIWYLFKVNRLVEQIIQELFRLNNIAQINHQIERNIIVIPG